MGSFGRIVCVALPFALTLASLIALLVAGLCGVTSSNKDLFMFSVNTTDLQVPASSVLDLITKRDVALETREFHSVPFHDPSLLTAKSADSDNRPSAGAVAVVTRADSTGSNVTVDTLGLYHFYQVNLLNYCYIAANGTKGCTKAKFNWAKDVLNMTMSTGNIRTLLTATGKNVTLPDGVASGLDAFGKVMKWTQVVYILAYLALGFELVLGFFAPCTRFMSCLTWLVAGITLVLVCAAAALSTAVAVVVVGALEGTAKWYGVTSELNGRFLAAVWSAAAFAIGASFFWLFTICCCAPNHSSGFSQRKRHSNSQDHEKLIPQGAYTPVPYDMHGGTGYGAPYKPTETPQQGYAKPPTGARRETAYEPYSHHNA